MILIPFFEVFPEIAENETRCLTVLHEDDDSEAPPPDTYGFVELFCPDPECDCRKVRIVVSDGEGRECATIQFGWEDQSFYDKYFGFEDHGLPGPSIPPMQFFGKYGFYFLEKFQEVCASDRAYVARLQKHYSMMKAEAEKRDLLQELKDRRTYRKPKDAVGRNEPCRCGSGKKYKKCCLLSIR